MLLPFAFTFHGPFGKTLNWGASDGTSKDCSWSYMLWLRRRYGMLCVVSLLLSCLPHRLTRRFRLFCSLSQLIYSYPASLINWQEVY